MSPMEWINISSDEHYLIDMAYITISKKPHLDAWEKILPEAKSTRSKFSL